MTGRVWVRAAIAAAALVVPAAPAIAQVTFGPRGGVSGQPDQVVLGAHIESPDLGHRVTFRPNFDVGFLSDVTLLTFNLELVHWMPLKNSRWQLYAGGGLGTNFWIDDEDKRFNGVLNAVFGLQHDAGLFAEMRVGMEPRVKIMAGYSMKLGG
jgi:hypothetical protein